MPHVSASAEFIRLTGHLLALDRGEELHLFEGLPAAWLRPGMVTRLNGLATPFGPLTLQLRVSGDGRTASLTLAPLIDPSCRKVVVHLPERTPGAAQAVRELTPGRESRLVISLEK